MDRDMLQQHLEQTKHHITIGAKHLYDQRALIARLERDGRHDEVTAAKELLAQLEDTLRLHLADRDRLQRALRELGQ
jgi:hypothetical protein